MLAEGGTEYGHAITLSRSKSLRGPYEVHPQNPIISSRDASEHPLQKAGHGDLVETPSGETLCSFLVGRPLSPLGRCTLGRETALAQMEWRKDNWLYAKNGKLPPLKLKVKGKARGVEKRIAKIQDDFESEDLSPDYQSLRRPVSDDWLTLFPRKGHLRLYGEEGLNSLKAQSLIARRVQAFHIQVSTQVAFRPKWRGQSAGLVAYYNTQHWLYCYMGLNQKGQRVVCIEVCDQGKIHKPLDCLLINETSPVDLKLKFKKAELQFYLKEDGELWSKIGPVLDGSILSDDYVRNEQVKYRPAFTGAFVGLCCQDPQGTRLHADFNHFYYEEFEDE